MDIRINPPKAEWPELCRRPADVNPQVRGRVEAIIERIRNGGDEALKDIAAEIDGFVPERFEITVEDIREAEKQVPEEVKEAVAAAAANIRAFHKAQMPGTVEVEPLPESVVSRSLFRSVPSACTFPEAPLPCSPPY